MSVEFPDIIRAYAVVSLAGGVGTIIRQTGFDESSLNRTGVGTFQIALEKNSSPNPLILCSYAGLGTQGTLQLTPGSNTIIDGAIFNAGGVVADGSVSFMVCVFPTVN